LVRKCCRSEIVTFAVVAEDMPMDWPPHLGDDELDA
jgi:hypothetical protein